MKAAVINRLLTGAHVDSDAVLISEMTVANWARRADIVLANGKLWAFEVKSDADSLGRLPGQIEVFQTYFEKFTVVAAERFESAILAMVPDGVGVWIVDSEGAIRQRVAARQSILTREVYASLMTAGELRALLVANGYRLTKGTQRTELMQRALRLPVSDLASAARDAIKRRHRSRHLDFLRSQVDVGTLQAMPRLQRPQQKRVIANSCTAKPYFDVVYLDIQASHPQYFLAPGGPVLKRKRP